MATIEEKPGTVSWILGNLPFVAIIEGGFLVLFGIVAYIYSGQASITALIPSIFGLGILKKSEKLLLWIAVVGAIASVSYTHLTLPRKA